MVLTLSFVYVPGEMRKVHVECRAVIGEVSNQESNLRSLVKLVLRAGVVFVPPFVVWRDEPG